ncbi:MAG: hypothetical protein HGB11_05320 [Chlorobiales bacterium]|jgi:hypothetical protein|nr:hypothetical protein [Chlorobiales bacterium]
MSKHTSNEEREHALTVHVFTISAGLVGVCLTGIGLLRIASFRKITRFGDDLLAADAVLFMTCCLLAFWSFKTPYQNHRVKLRWVTDIIFVLALGLMVLVCGIIAYAVV